MTKINRSHYVLLKLIEKNDNKFCADCGTEGTRWASWNLGIFLCIRCAGIHRKLGVHISKVKSVDLDSWTPEQLQMMETVGNTRSHEMYEAVLPDNFIRPQTNYMIEEFIRSKYEHKRYCIKSEVSSSINAKCPTSVNSTEVEEGLPKKLINFEEDDDKNSSEGTSSNKVDDSEDSLSEPEYLRNQKASIYHKVHSDGDLLTLNTGATNSSNNNDLIKLENKSAIMSLYDQSQSSTGYQMSSGMNTNQGFHHRFYGSSKDTPYHSTTSIPMSSTNSYLKQIQEKLSAITYGFASRFKSYESPADNSDPIITNSNTQQQSRTSNTGHTLQPDLWR